MNTKAIPALITDTSITVSVHGLPHTVRKDEPTFNDLREAIRESRWDDVMSLFSTTIAITTFTDGDIVIADEEITYKGHPVHGIVVNKILDLMYEGFDVAPLTRFLARVQNNPSITARQELYGFCEANGFMIDEGGYLIAYKSVRADYTDKRTGTMNNAVGAVVSMDRADCDDDRDRTCSTGLHFAAYKYARGFGGSTDRLMVLRVDPADVVAIPSDYENEKGRACRYTIIDELEDREALESQTVFTNDQFQVAPSPLDDFFEDDDDDNNDTLTGDTIRSALHDAKWVVAGPSGAAHILGIPESTLRGHMKRFGITR